MKKSILVALAAGLLSIGLAVAADGYLIVLKNGSQLPAAKQFEIKGQSALITLQNGTVTSLPLKMIDLVKTEQFNQLGFGTAKILEGMDSGIGPAKPTPTPRPRSLGEIATVDITGRGNDDIQEVATGPTPTPKPAVKLRLDPYPEPRVVSAINEYFDEKRLYLYRTSVGTRPDHLYIGVTTDSEKDVFDALRTICQAYVLIANLGSEGIPALVEVNLETSIGKPAGKFQVTVEDARPLAENQVSVEAFYVQNVIF